LSTKIEARDLRNGERQIAVIVFPNFSSLDVALVDQVFHYANQISGKDENQYVLRLVSSGGGLITGTANMRVWSEPAASATMDVIFISGGDGAYAATRDPVLLGWIRQARRNSPLLIGIAEGSAVIEAAGVSHSNSSESRPGKLNDMATPLRDIYDPSGALLKALSIVKRDLGIQTAREVGERVSPDSSRWLSAILGEPTDDIRRDKIRETAEWIELHCGRPITVTDISQFAMLSERSLLRHFKSVMGMTPSDYLLKVRLDVACRLLGSTALPIDKIARHCNFSSGTALAKLFRKRMSVSPSEYRAAAYGQDEMNHIASGSGKLVNLQGPSAPVISA